MRRDISFNAGALVKRRDDTRIFPLTMSVILTQAAQFERGKVVVPEMVLCGWVEHIANGLRFRSGMFNAEELEAWT